MTTTKMILFLGASEWRIQDSLGGKLSVLGRWVGWRLQIEIGISEHG